MPTAKGKGGSTSHRYRPASEYDDATLAQKRAYWRTKKREQRARVSKRIRKPQDCLGERLRHINAPAVVSSTVSEPFAVTSFQTKDESHKTANVSLAAQSRNTVEERSMEVSERQREKWVQTVELNKVLPQLPATCSITARADGGNTVTVKCLTARGAVNSPVTSPTSSGTQMDTSLSVPAVRVTRLTNGSSAKTTPQPCVSMQGPSFPKMQHKAQVAVRIQPKLLPTSVTTGMSLVSSPCDPVSIRAEGKPANTPPQSRTKSALVTTQGAKGVDKAQPSLESEEEKAAKRREQWRIKKREQRAKLAAQIAKARERTQGVEIAAQRQTTQKAGLLGNTGLQHLSSHSIFRGTAQKQCPARVKTLFISAKRENDKLQGRVASLAAVNLQAIQVKVQKPHGNRRAQTAITSDVISVKKTGDAHRKLPSHAHLANLTRGSARCKTPRQRFIESQKILTNQRNIRFKSPLYSGLGTRNIPKIDPNDTPEQVIAKRREYWRIKKREQRAKLSMEVKARLKEKDSLMRRVKRYQKILEDMRKARALSQPAGSTLTNASETIGGFIGEDGTVTINIPQAPTDHNTAAHEYDEENHTVANNTSIIQSQHNQPNTKRLCPAQVKVSFPLSGQLANKPPRPRSQHESTTVCNSHSSSIQSGGQLKLTHPQTSLNAISGASTAGSNLGGCVMKLAVSSTTPSLSALSVDPELREEERMAKKREYWRIKKREQRAARAVRLKQGVLHARASAALLRRKAQKQVALISLPLSRRLSNHPGNVQPLCNNSGPTTPHTNEIKQESEAVPAVDLNSHPEQAICPDIKPPTSPPPPVAQPESDITLSAESQATTLLAVASMKKLLEESLSTVAGGKCEQADFKIETKEETLEEEIKPNLPQLFFEKDEVAPIAADLTLQIKSWQPDTDALLHTASLSPHLKDSSHVSETLPRLPATSEVVLHPTREHSSQTASNFIVNPCSGSSDGPSSCRMQRIQTKRASQPNCCSEPPKLHHPSIDQLHPQQQHCRPQFQPQVQNQNSTLPSASARYFNVMTEQCGLTSLQRKREYWKLMKRQQRARLKARQKETPGEGNSLLSSRGTQARGPKGLSFPAKLALQLKPPVVSLTPLPSISTVLVTGPSTCNADQSPDTLQVTLPITSVSSSLRTEQNNMSTGPPKVVSQCLGIPEGEQEAMPGSQKSMSSSTDVDSAPSPPTLKPPDNPLSSINFQPIEPPSQSSDSTQGPLMIPCAQLQSPTPMIPPPAKLATISTMVPPKPIPGEVEEDFLRRKREYWRIKKKEQRARKAIRDKGITPRRVSNTWRPILPAEDLQTQESKHWVTSTESDHQMSISVDSDPGSFPYSNYTAPLEDEAEVLFVDYENNDGEDGPASETLWRTHYLMDYDPLNQLLVCMVCGDLQYSHSLEGVRAHIDEAHPETLTLEPGERQRILEAWDEQVSQRERFFTSQLQQHSGSLEEAHRS
ncbi:putative protein C11orf95 -like protein [Channa argus]|uniref:SPIN-DOC-like zinc-finger domain-containing protein n=1 Tax=Channa argus TaxID=215402 RepID=A0A6G1Q4D5_CHAAH|nr:putative protein C11orf95 -like protein [Channa argus]KAK2900283.1 hypothetical protein Q8A73_013412 [Channa argus]